MLLWDHSAFDKLPQHVRSIDVGAFRHNGSAVSRELFGHSECIMGLIDSYPAMHGYQKLLKQIEQVGVDWRWKLKGRVHRLGQVHGDYHPWNILSRLSR